MTSQIEDNSIVLSNWIFVQIRRKKDEKRGKLEEKSLLKEEIKRTMIELLEEGYLNEILEDYGLKRAIDEGLKTERYKWKSSAESSPAWMKIKI